LNITLQNVGNANVSIYNITGRRVYQTAINRSTTIPTSSFNHGVYFVKTDFAGKSSVARVLLR